MCSLGVLAISMNGSQRLDGVVVFQMVLSGPGPHLYQGFAAHKPVLKTAPYNPDSPEGCKSSSLLSNHEESKFKMTNEFEDLHPSSAILPVISV